MHATIAALQQRDTNLPSVLAINCTLKRGPQPSSTDKLIDDMLSSLREHGCSADGPVVRAVDFNILPGVKSDEGDGDDWPQIRKQILSADILLFGTPIWLGQPSSVAKRVLERMDAFLGETDHEERMVSFGRVALVAVVGNEDGAHHVSAELFQALSDVGFSIPAGASVYWVGEAMQSVNYIDLRQTPERVGKAIETSAANAAHLAKLLKQWPYPPPKS
jgi:multimeric flavodoxin WrbA